MVSVLLPYIVVMVLGRAPTWQTLGSRSILGAVR